MTTRDHTKTEPETNTEPISKSVPDSVREESTETETHQDDRDGISLLTSEVVLKNVHPSWANWPILMGLAGLFGLTSLSALAQLEIGNFIGSMLVVGLLVGYVYYARKRSRYIVTNQRVVKNVGLLRSSTGETRIKDIRSLATNQGLLERLFGKGSIQIDSTGADGRLSIKGVKDYEHLANVIRERQRELEN